MARIITRGQFRDSVTYWPAPTPDGSGGNTFGAPQAIKARWERKNELAHDMNGEQFISFARVYTDDVVTLSVGGYLYLGTSVATDPGDVKGAYKIRAFERIPALRGPRYDNKAVL